MWHVGLAPPSDVLHDYYYYSYYTIIAVCKAVDVYWHLFEYCWTSVCNVVPNLFHIAIYYDEAGRMLIFSISFYFYIPQIYTILLLLNLLLALSVFSLLFPVVVVRSLMPTSGIAELSWTPTALTSEQEQQLPLQTNNLLSHHSSVALDWGQINLDHRRSYFVCPRQGCAFTKMHPVSSSTVVHLLCTYVFFLVWFILWICFTGHSFVHGVVHITFVCFAPPAVMWTLNLLLFICFFFNDFAFACSNPTHFFMSARRVYFTFR